MRYEEEAGEARQNVADRLGGTRCGTVGKLASWRADFALPWRDLCHEHKRVERTANGIEVPSSVLYSPIPIRWQ